MLGLWEPRREQVKKIWHNRRGSGILLGTACGRIRLLLLSVFPRYPLRLSGSSFENLHAANRAGDSIGPCRDRPNHCNLKRSHLWICIFHDWTGLGVAFKIELCEFKTTHHRNSSPARPTSAVG